MNYNCVFKLLNVARLNADMLSDLPVTLDMIKNRLRNKSSIADELKTDSCLTISNNADAYFLGELQMLSDILAKVRQKHVILDLFDMMASIFKIERTS